MNGGQDHGRDDGLRARSAPKRTSRVPRRWERRAFGLTLAMGAHRQLEHRYDPPRAGDPAARRISLVELLRDLDQGRREAGRSDRPGLGGGVAGGAGPHGSSAGQARRQGRRRSGHAGTRRSRRSSGAARSPLRRRRSCRDPKHQPDRAHPPAALCARQAGRRRARARHPRVPRFECPRSRRNPQWLYTIRFTGRELWGAEADATLSVSIDAWERYLEPA